MSYWYTHSLDGSQGHYTEDRKPISKRILLQVECLGFPQNSHAETPTSTAISGGGASGQWSGHGDRALMKRIRVLTKETQGAPSPLHRVWTQWGASCPWTRRGSSVDTRSAGALILGSPASRTVWFLLATWFMALHYSIPKGLNRYIGQDSIYRLMAAWSWQGRTGVPKKTHVFGMLEQFCILTRWWLRIYTGGRVVQTTPPNTPKYTHTEVCVWFWWNLNKVCRLHLCQFSGFAIELQDVTIGGTGWGVPGTFQYYFCHFLWIYNYFQTKKLKRSYWRVHGIERDYALFENI